MKPLKSIFADHMKHLGATPEEQIKKNEEKFLLSVKRMMPRWVNSLPDSEFLALTT